MSSAAEHCNRGVALLEEGSLELARAEFRRAVELAPRNGRFHRYLVEISPDPVSDTHLQQMEALAAEFGDNASDDRINIAFALAKAHAAAGDRERSFVHLRTGNALKRTIVAYDEAETLRALGTLPALVGKDLVAAMHEVGDRSPVPIFIVGMPRSGTTLVEQLLAAHSAVHAAGELRIFETALRGFAPVTSDPSDSRAFAAALGRELRALGERYVRELRAFAPAARRITDKNPLNFRFAGLIHLALPQARLIHVRRAPLDTCFSCYGALFSEEYLDFAYDLGELGRYYRAYAQLVAYWRSVLPAGAMLEVTYEALVDDFATQARRIVAHCGLDWNDACTAFWEVKRPVRTASAAEVRRPLFRTSIGRAEPYRAELEPLVRELAGIVYP